jgi:hypothetical protein
MAAVRSSKRGGARPQVITLELKQFEKIEKLVMVLGRHVLGEQRFQEILRDAGVSTKHQAGRE